MTLLDLISRVRSYTRDTTSTLFDTNDIKDFINEGVDKLKHIKQLEGMSYLENDSDVPKLLPPKYHYLLSVYAVCRCYSQDEQHYLAQTFADEFNGIYDLIEFGIREGTIIITNEDGVSITDEVKNEVLDDVYFKKYYND